MQSAADIISEFYAMSQLCFMTGAKLLKGVIEAYSTGRSGYEGPPSPGVVISHRRPLSAEEALSLRTMC